MNARHGFSRRDMLVAVAAIGLMLALVLPAIHRPRITSRRNACVIRMKQLVLALHNYHDVFNQLPHLTSTQIRGVAPGSVASADNPGAGYSWIVAILPYLEETTLYNAMRESKTFSISPFDPTMKPTRYASGKTPPHFSAIELDALRCPSRSAENFASAPEYTALGTNHVAACSYVALSATHLDCMLGDPMAPDYIPPNGILIPGPTVVDFRDIKDGTSKTLMLVETREAKYTSWYDGTVAWVVGANPNQQKPVRDESGLLTLGADQSTALCFGPSSSTPSRAYLPMKVHNAILTDWTWGPSSEHSIDVGVVVHGIADGAVRTITDDIDPTLYLRLITRADKEPANLPE